MDKSVILKFAEGLRRGLHVPLTISLSRRCMEEILAEINARGRAGDYHRIPATTAESQDRRACGGTLQRAVLPWGASHELPLEYGPDI